jgi:imidazolonepropionase-like amidohydrolase
MCFDKKKTTENDQQVKGPHSAPHPEHQTLIKNVSIFNGTSETLITGKDIVLTGNEIKKLVPAGGDEKTYEHVIDGKGGYLSPGLIDMHWHMAFFVFFEDLAQIPIQYAGFLTARDAEACLMRGFTTCRDAAGDVVSVQRAVDNGLIPGPRIYPSQAAIGIYTGHADFRNKNVPVKQWGGPLDPIEIINAALLCNTPDEVRIATRNNLYQGATQIKLLTSGSVTGVADPLYVSEFTQKEIEAAVEAAEDFGTYVQVHCYNTPAIKRSLKAGVKTIEHGNLIDEEGMEMLVGSGAYFTPTVLVDAALIDDPNKLMASKARQALAGSGKAFELAKKYKAKVLLGSDPVFSDESRAQQAKEMTFRKQWCSDPEIMIQATGNGGEALWELTGKRNPYGKVGVIEEGAMADILIFNKNFMKDVSIVEDAENNLKLIVKDGKVYKNTL